MAVSSYWKTQNTGLQSLKKEVSDVVAQAESEIEELHRAVKKADTYTKLQDAGHLIESTLPALQDIADVMKDIGWRLEDKDRIDG